MMIAVIAVIAEMYLVWSSLWAIPDGASFRNMGFGVWVFAVATLAFLINGLLALQCLAMGAWRSFLVAAIACLIGGPGSLATAVGISSWITHMHHLVWEP